MSASTRPDRSVVLMFAGQGAQHPRMGAGLYGHDRTFSESMDEAFHLFGDHGERLYLEWLSKSPSSMYEDVCVAQPLLYAVNHALGRMLLEWGVRPAALIGHSVGELAAASLAGVLDFAEGVRLLRGRMAQFADTPPGGMLAVAASVEEVADVLDTNVHLAAVNASRQLLLSGQRSPLDRAARFLSARGLVCQRVNARQAFHSPVMAEAVAESLPDWRSAFLRPPSLTVYSCYTRAVLTDSEACDPRFWASQPAATVHFAPTLTRLLEDHPDCSLVEAGPGNSLTMLARRRSATSSRVTVLSLLPDRCRGDEADRRSMETARSLLLGEGTRQPVHTTVAGPGGTT